jgi:hypothetical protein
MIKKSLLIILVIVGVITFSGCCEHGEKETKKNETTDNPYKMKKYAKVKLTADISHLSENQKEMLKLLFQAADLMDEIFWQENVDAKDAFMLGINNEKDRKYALINYGPWDEMNNLAPFIEGYGEKPAGAQFYPENMTVKEFEKFNISPITI